MDINIIQRENGSKIVTWFYQPKDNNIDLEHDQVLWYISYLL